MDFFKKTAAKRSSDPEVMGLKAVSYIAADEDRLSRFVALTGCGQDDLRARLADPAFLGGALDFVMGDEALAAEFADQEGLSPEDFQVLRAKLP